MSRKIKSKKQRIERLLERAIKKGSRLHGASVRRLRSIVARAYESNPEELRGFFHDKHMLLSGLATAAYYELTGDESVLSLVKYSGLGAHIKESSKGLKFEKYQLLFARLEGNALQESVNNGYALGYSENSGEALQRSLNGGAALCGSENSGNALWDSHNWDRALVGSRNLENSLMGSLNEGRSLTNSMNSGKSLWHSENDGKALHNSVNWEESLWYSDNKCNSLVKSENSDDSLAHSLNTENALNDSTNSGNLYGSKIVISMERRYIGPFFGAEFTDGALKRGDKPISTKNRFYSLGLA